MDLYTHAATKGERLEDYQKVQVNYRDVRPEDYQLTQVEDGDIIRLVKPMEVPTQWIVGEEE